MEKTTEQPEINKKEISDSDALTSIRETYTLATTLNAEEVMKRNFLETLAEISLSIASRRIRQPDKGAEQCEQ